MALSNDIGHGKQITRKKGSLQGHVTSQSETVLVYLTVENGSDFFILASVDFQVIDPAVIERRRQERILFLTSTMTHRICADKSQLPPRYDST